MPDQPTAIEACIEEAVSRIGNRFHGHEAVLRQMLAKPIATAYHAGRNNAIREYRTTEDVANELGLSRIRLRRIAHDQNIGTTIADVRLFLPEDIERLRNRPDGRRRG